MVTALDVLKRGNYFFPFIDSLGVEPKSTTFVIQITLKIIELIFRDGQMIS